MTELARIERVEEDIERIRKDIETLYKSNNNNAERLAGIEKDVSYLVKGMDELKDSIKKISDLRGQRWDTLVASGISAVVSALVAFAGTLFMLRK